MSCSCSFLQCGCCDHHRVAVIVVVIFLSILIEFPYETPSVCLVSFIALPCALLVRMLSFITFLLQLFSCVSVFTFERSNFQAD